MTLTEQEYFLDIDSFIKTPRNNIYCKIYKCYNKTCYNFTSNHDLSGTWCSEECFIQSENPELPRLTRKELLDMKEKYGWLE